VASYALNVGAHQNFQSTTKNYRKAHACYFLIYDRAVTSKNYVTHQKQAAMAYIRQIIFPHFCRKGLRALTNVAFLQSFVAILTGGSQRLDCGLRHIDIPENCRQLGTIGYSTSSGWLIGRLRC
jgi:hypothetical protein